MNLDDFIKTAITDIVKGIVEAKKDVDTYGAKIGSDPMLAGVKNDTSVVPSATGREQISLVEFDIALSESNASEKKGGIGVFLASVGVGGQASSGKEFSSLSKIKFTIPLMLPTKTISKK